MKKQKFALAISALALAACSEPSEQPPAEDAVASPVGPEATVAAPEQPYDGPIPKPILIGSDGADLDACGAMAEVANLAAGGETYLGVNDAPADGVKERDRLEEGQQVAICATEGDWSGIVYPQEDQTMEDCGTNSPVAAPEPYRGACFQGWVRSRYLDTIAG